MFKNVLLLTALCAVPKFEILAQSAAPPQTPSSSPYEIKSESRLVFEDVSVLDALGKPVRGLPASSFHIFDRRIPQTLRDFQEIDHSGVEDTAPSKHVEQPGTFSNASLLSNRGTVVALLIDPETISTEDQMYLRLEALKFVDRATINTSIAVFRSNRGVPVLLQPLTRDRAMLKAAITDSVPKVTRPNGDVFEDALIELRNISDYLRPVPGRKAVIWLAGAFPLYQEPNYQSLCAPGASCGLGPNSLNSSAQLDAYRALEEARIAVYPVDVRGVLMGGTTHVPVAASGPTASLGGSDPSGTPGNISGNIGAKPVSESERAAGQYDEMDHLADATGGHAFYSNNDVAAILSRALQLTQEGYTVTYRPKDDAEDGKWHAVTIRVDGPYTVHYRAGYIAAKPPPPAQRRLMVADRDGPLAAAPTAAKLPTLDASSQPSSTPSASPNTLESTAVDKAEPLSSGATKPLIFSAHLVSQAKVGKTREVDVRYVIPRDQLSFGGDSSGQARFELVALAYNASGDTLSSSVQIVNTRYSAEQMQLATRIGTPADQVIEVAKGAHYLLLSVRDLRTNKVGVVQLPLTQVPEGKKPEDGPAPPAGKRK